MRKLSIVIVLATILTGCGVPEGAVSLDFMGNNYYLNLDKSRGYSGDVVFGQKHSDWSEIYYHYEYVYGNPKFDIMPALRTSFSIAGYDCESAKQDPVTKIFEAPKSVNHLGEDINFATANCYNGILLIDVFWNKGVSKEEYSGVVYGIDIVGVEGKEFELNFQPHPDALPLVRKNERAKE
ncbi:MULTISPECIES: hypothetical protein [unclassified Colwellia]|uniref:hypothetical protein n=1 Tax=unclassified Colwellia TaxID=196834 RepID=UPI0015F5469D|nr:MULTISPECIES: hypothetical protein [unclassified Colwellia]MBA6379684.1 hypothetical protein [Colwellia sp. BRX10-7]MBA6388501.1 hypothetical protein [Colwellia sp. BRX10-2]MBA6402985.1 hypothetical protein [Colwellia sp. BRX10-5]MBA6406302.1 hypothetical protein [Colwellia sp. BRX10-1]